YPGGIAAGTDAIITQLQLPPDEARKVVDLAKAQMARNQGRQVDPGAFVFLVIFGLFFVLPFLRAMRGGGRRYGSGVWIIPGGGWGG
ncbi:hypothetical protein AAEH85_21985, partial [Shewanella algae]|uniref:hypothetical protein n=1 Tax=Shewanella algae TaxID=38313 RepID=UPI00313BC81B